MPAPEPPGSLIADDAPGRLRVTSESGEQIVLIAPRIQADSLVGTNESVALAEVSQIKVRRLNHANTVVSLLGISLVGFIVYGATSYSCCAIGLGGTP
jgi:hypothetical protein